MGNPAEDTADTQKKLDTEVKNSEPTFADKVNDVVKNMVRDDNGNWTLPDDKELSEEVRFAAIAEKRFRDTQSAYTKERQKAKALEAEKTVLLKKAVNNVQVKLTPEQAEELEDLKFSDPEAWRKKVNAYEADALKEHEQQINEEVKQVSTSSLDEEEKERRSVVLKEFLNNHEGFELNDSVIQNDIPPRITKKLANGEVTFEDFLQECYDYLTTGKVVKQTETTLGQPNLNSMGGGSTPDKNAVKEDIITSYRTETF